MPSGSASDVARELTAELGLGGFGVIVRTAAEEASKDGHRGRTSSDCSAVWSDIQESLPNGGAPRLIYEEPAAGDPGDPGALHRRLPAAARSTTRASTTRWSATSRPPTPTWCPGCTLYDEEHPDLRAVPRRGSAAQGPRSQGVAPLGRPRRRRPDRGAHRDRREHRPVRRPLEPRGDGAAEQPGGGRGDRPPAAPARHRRDHRHRLHRHGGHQEPRGGPAEAARVAGQGQDPHPGVRGVATSAWSR